MRTASVLIAGAGPVGLALAALLVSGRCRERLEVHVVDARGEPRWEPAHMDLRVYALSRGSQRVLERLGLWSTLAAARVSPYRRMHVWEGDEPFGPSSLAFDSADVGEPDLGHIVEDALLRTLLLERVRASGRARVSFGALVEALEWPAGGVVLRLSGGERLGGSLLVAADGSRSRVRSLAELPVTVREYGQQAVVAHVASERPHEETAWQRFLPDGPLAFLPLADGRSSIVWSTSPAEAQTLVASDDAAFLAALDTAAGGVLGPFGPVSARAAFPLRVLHAPRYSAPHLALVGDAAHTVHPLAGQGMNLGLADAACLAQVIEDALARGEHPGDLRVLRRFERRRKSEDLAMLLALDALHHLFRLRGFSGPRALGLRLVDRSTLLKRALIRQALGVLQWSPPDGSAAGP